MSPRPCSVSFTDLRGVRHEAEVQAESLFEAAALALKAFRGSGWVEGVGPASEFQVEVPGPVVRHRVTVGQIRRWVEGAVASPAERLRRERVREMLLQAGA
jgi:hypothetical protein